LKGLKAVSEAVFTCSLFLFIKRNVEGKCKTSQLSSALNERMMSMSSVLNKKDDFTVKNKDQNGGIEIE